MANTLGFTVDLRKCKFADWANYVTQDKNGTVKQWSRFPVAKDFIWRWGSGEPSIFNDERIVTIGGINSDWRDAIIEWQWPLRDSSGQKVDSDKPWIDLLFSVDFTPLTDDGGAGGTRRNWNCGEFEDEHRSREAACPGEGCICQICGSRFYDDVNVPDDVWLSIRPAGKPADSGLLCGQCIFDRFRLRCMP